MSWPQPCDDGAAQDVENIAILSHGPPEIMPLPMKREKHCIQAPLIPTG
jgi:hypothetical protein